MGWDFTHRAKGTSSEDWFCKEYGDGRNGGRGIIKLMGGTNSPSTLYAAYRTEEGEVCALVILTKWARDPYYNFGYKGMGESSGPFYYDCPQGILDLLSPASTDSAREWREACRANLAKRAARKPLKFGSLVKFAEPVHFSRGAEFSQFICVDARKLHFKVPGYYGLYKLTKALLDNAEIINPEEVAA